MKLPLAAALLLCCLMHAAAQKAPSDMLDEVKEEFYAPEENLQAPSDMLDEVKEEFNAPQEAPSDMLDEVEEEFDAPQEAPSMRDEVKEELYHWGYHPRVELQSYNYPSYYVGARGNSAYILQQAQPRRWKIVTPGLCGTPGTVSIQSATNHDRYLRHHAFVVYEQSFSSDTNKPLFRRDACFIQRKNKWFPGHDAFEGHNIPGRFMRHRGSRLYMDVYVSTALFKKDASFRVVVPTCRTVQSFNFRAYYWGLYGNAAYIKRSADRWVVISPGLAGHIGSVSFRSCSDATRYLRHANSLLWQHPYQSTALYINDATFTVRKNKFFSGWDAYESVNFPGYFIRHQNSRLKISRYDGTHLYKQDASFNCS